MLNTERRKYWCGEAGKKHYIVLQVRLQPGRPTFNPFVALSPCCRCYLCSAQ